MYNQALRQFVKVLITTGIVTEKNLPDIEAEMMKGPRNTGVGSRLGEALCLSVELLYPPGRDEDMMTAAKKVPDTQGHVPAVAMDIEYYEVVGNTDNMEGKGRRKVLGVFPLQEGGAANSFAQGKGVFGSPADVQTQQTSVLMMGDRFFRIGDEVVFNDSDEFKKQQVAKVLSKLSKEDIEILKAAKEPF